MLPIEVVKEEGLVQPFATVDHLKRLQQFQEKGTLKLAPKLTETITDPSRFSKMSVAEAMTFFSEDTSKALRYMSEATDDKSLLTTAVFIEKVNLWFSLVNSRKKTFALSHAVEEKYNEATAFLREFIGFIRSCKFGAKQHWKPFQSGMILSTTSVLALSESLLKDNGFSFVLTSRFSQDPVENLFSLLRLEMIHFSI